MYQQRLQDESYLAFLGMLGLDLVKTKHVNRVPMLVLGGAEDETIVQRQIRRTAAVYGAEAEIFPDMGHDMMLEPGWQAVAERIDAWLLNQNFETVTTSAPKALFSENSSQSEEA